MLNNIAGVLAPTTPLVTNSYESIQSTTVGSGGQATITFTSIPSTFKHLQIRGIGYNSGGNALVMNFNGDFSSSYWWHRLFGNGAGSATASNSAGSSTFISLLSGAGLGNATSTFSASVIDVLDYANTNKYKTTRHLGGLDKNGSGGIELDSGMWNSTSAITSITLAPYSGSFGEFSSFALYGIKG